MSEPEREVELMTRAVIAWGHARWPGCRAIRELALGDRRIDVVFVTVNNVVGIEIKSSVDSLDRLAAQVAEFERYMPEVWIAVAPRWLPEVERLYAVHNKMVATIAGVETVGTYRSRIGGEGKRPHRDELSIMRLLELLWADEGVRIAERTGVVPGARHTQIKYDRLKPLLARLLTGNEILKEVCRELRARPITGAGSDPRVTNS